MNRINAYFKSFKTIKRILEKSKDSIDPNTKKVQLMKFLICARTANKYMWV